MGTNYYLHTDVCEHCQRPAEKIHIGKSSHGWTFSFHGYREPWELPIIETVAQWREQIAQPHVKIVDEYGGFVPVDSFWDMVESKRGEVNNHFDYCAIHHPEPSNMNKLWKDGEHSFSGHDFS